VNKIDFSSSTRNFYFTPKEQEVLDYMAYCYTYAEISTKMCITKKTLLKHIDNIGVKAGIRTQLGITRYAIEHGYGYGKHLVVS
jgi:DNA-binding NarL/FixJ family response regulator